MTSSGHRPSSDHFDWGSRDRKILQRILIAAVMIFIGCFVWAFETAHAPIKDNHGQPVDVFVIRPGQGLNQIAHAAEEANLVADDFIFKIFAYAYGADRDLKAGEYKINPDQSLSDLIAMFTDAKIMLHPVTIREGLTVHQVSEDLKSNPVLSGEITTIPPEGSLYPETYNVPRGIKRQELLNIMQQNMHEVLAELEHKYDLPQPLSSMEEVVNLASIVERETSIDMERPKVAAVFLNRLRMKMGLQSDPTVIYAVTNGTGILNRRLYRKDLKRKSKFNTYLHRGLPPTPIANPSRASLEAVMRPDSHNYLYFVADGTGGHAFAVNLKQHNRNVAKWRKIRDSQ